MASTRDKNRARALMHANPDLNYTSALRRVQADRETTDWPRIERTEVNSIRVVIDPLHELATPKDLLAAHPDLNGHTALVDLRGSNAR